MFSRRMILRFAVVLCYFVSVRSVLANVNGKAFPVRIYTSFQTSTTNNYIFSDDGGNPNAGPFAVMEGGEGTWQQLPISSVALWSATYSTISTTVGVTGIQIGTQMFGFGNGNTGGLFLILPYP